MTARVASEIDNLFFPWEKEERRRYRQRQTAAARKCGCGNCIARDCEDGLCSRCREIAKKQRRQQVLDRLADSILEGESE